MLSPAATRWKMIEPTADYHRSPKLTHYLEHFGSECLLPARVRRRLWQGLPHPFRILSENHVACVCPTFCHLLIEIGLQKQYHTRLGSLRVSWFGESWCRDTGNTSTYNHAMLAPHLFTSRLNGILTVAALAAVLTSFLAGACGNARGQAGTAISYTTPLSTGVRLDAVGDATAIPSGRLPMASAPRGASPPSA